MWRAVKVAAIVSLLQFTSHVVRAQPCAGDFNGDGQVSIDELILAVGNSLNGCSGTGLTCPIDFSSDNTAQGTPDCFYEGRWSQTCGAADLQADWISDGQTVVVDFMGFNPPLFYGANVRSANSADLIGWFTKLDASDLTETPGTLTLGPSGQTLVLTPNDVPFQIESCNFAQYNGGLIEVDVPTPTAQRATAQLKIGPVFERLRAARAQKTLHNLQRR